MLPVASLFTFLLAALPGWPQVKCESANPERCAHASETGIGDSVIVLPAGTHISATLQQPFFWRKARAGTLMNLRTSVAVLVRGQSVMPPGAVLTVVLDDFDSGDSIPDRVRLRARLTQLSVDRGHSVELGQHGPAVEIDVRLRGTDLVASSGTLLDVTLRNPLELDRALTERAIAQVSCEGARYNISNYQCFVPGSPGTPDVQIPATPTVMGPEGIPIVIGNPGTVIPGTPATPPTWVPCVAPCAGC